MKKIIFFLGVGFLAFLMAGCEHMVFGIPKLQRKAPSARQRAELARAYEKRLKAIEEANRLSRGVNIAGDP